MDRKGGMTMEYQALLRWILIEGIIGVGLILLADWLIDMVFKKP